MELGLYTFADLSPDPRTGERIDPEQRMRDLMEEIRLADEVGLDVFGVGEHHRPDYLVSSPAPVLAAAAVTTKNIRLTSAVTVLSSDDPVRVFQDFATVDLLSGGRAEIMAGRGSYIESFPLFGQDLDDYDELFAEKLDLLLKIREEETVTWQGHHRPSIAGRGVYPRPAQAEIPIWVAVGGTPESVERAARRNLPMGLAIIGGSPARFRRLVDFYRSELKEPQKVGINSIGYLADTSQRATEEHFPFYADSMGRIGKERGWPPLTRGGYDAGRGPEGALVVGSPAEVVDKILYEHSLFRHDRFMLQFGPGTLPHAQVMRAIELYGKEVAPAVRRALDEGPKGPALGRVPVPVRV